jgi:beta-lactamase class A
MKFARTNKSFIVSILITLLIGSTGGFFYAKHKYSVNISNSVNIIREVVNDYKFIDPLLAINVDDQRDFKEFTPFENNVQTLIGQLQKSGKVNDVGFYFRDFNSGLWVGSGENQSFFPASLLKVPLMIAYYKAAETQPSLLSQKLTYKGGDDANKLELIKASENLQVGQSYTIDELIRRMIVYSDNNAANLLVLNLDDPTFSEIYKDLGIGLPTNVNDSPDFLSPQQYSLFLRILRNATYLSREDSEKALSLLTQTEFKNGLVAGVPDGTVVAHKFGEYEENSNGQILHELHDCGIIFAPSHPYLLCIMTRGQNEPDLENDIKSLSSLVYNQVTTNN